MSDQKKKLLFGRPNMEEIRRKTTQNEIWKSIFRHNWQDNQRNRALQVLDNVFLHLHPVLAPSLRSQPGADDPALRIRYTQRYAAVARYLYFED